MEKIKFEQGEKIYFVHRQTNNVLYGFIDYQENQYPNMTRIVKIRTCDEYNSLILSSEKLLKKKLRNT